MISYNSKTEDLRAALDTGIQVTGRGKHFKMSLLNDDECLSSTNITLFHQYVRGTPVLAGGIGGVSTPELHRRKGYSRVVMENALRWMQQRQWDMAILLGIKDFYPKFGYAPALPRQSWSIATDSLPKASDKNTPALKWRAFKPDDVIKVLKLYQHDNAAITGTFKRQASSWHDFRKDITWGTKPDVWVAEVNNQIQAYIVFDKQNNKYECVEASTKSQYLPAMAAFCRTYSKRRKLNMLSLNLHAEHALVVYLKQMQISCTIDYHNDGSFMLRFIDIISCLKKIVPQLSAVPNTSLTIQTNLQIFRLITKGGSTTVQQSKSGSPDIRIPQWALAQLLYGFSSAASLKQIGHLRGSQRSIQALDNLFPKVSAHFNRVDQF